MPSGIDDESDLDFAILNPAVQEDLESRAIFDPASLDRAPHPLANIADVDLSGEPVDAAYEVSAVGGRCWPRAPFEPIP